MLDHLAVRLLVVRHRPGHADLGSGGGQLRHEHRAVRLVDLARAQLRSGLAELGARGHDRHPWTARARHVPHTGCRERADLSGADPRARGHDLASHGDISSTRTDVRAGPNGVGDVQRVVPLLDVLDGNDGIGPLGDGAAGGDRHGAAGRQRARRRRAGGDPEHDRELPRRLLRADRVAVHCGGRKRRQVDGGAGGLRHHTAQRGPDRDAFAAQRLDAVEDCRERFLEGDKAHRAGGPAGTVLVAGARWRL